MIVTPSPLAEGRELKYDPAWMEQFRLESPLAEGRELKYKGHNRRPELAGRPSRRGVN